MEASFCPGCMTRAQAEDTQCDKCAFPRPQAGWPVDPFVGRQVKGKYRVESRLGGGGFGLVFLARQVQGEVDLGEVVLKFMHRELATDRSFRRRFINEARAARKIRSPHVVKVFDLDFDQEGVPFIVMEYLEGDSLQDRLAREGRISPPVMMRVGIQVSAALHECHGAGVLHRDLKPDNLLLLKASDCFVKVIDFGIARVPGLRGTPTRSGVGTPPYMAPEQILGQEIDGGVDIYALGVILYECLAGCLPLRARKAVEYVQKTLDVEPVPLRVRSPEMPESLEGLLGQMMAKKRSDRPGSMMEVERRLRAIGVSEGWIPREVDQEQASDEAAREARQGQVGIGTTKDLPAPSACAEAVAPELESEAPASASIPAPLLEHLRKSGLYDVVEVGQRSFHVQTEVIGGEADPKIQSTVLEGGALLYARNEPYPREIQDTKRAVEVIEGKHKETMDRLVDGDLSLTDS